MTTSSTATNSAGSPLQKNVSEHTTMTTPLHDEVVVTPTKRDNVISPTPSTEYSVSNADLIFGEFVAEGGFCSIYELTGIQNLETNEWILEPPKQEAPPKHHKRGGSAFGSLALLSPSKKVGGGHHKRGKSTSNLQAAKEKATLPPLIQSVQVTILAPFLPPAAYTLATANSLTSSSGSKKSLLRRSHSREVKEQEAQAPPYVLKCLKPAVFGTPKVLDMGLKDMEIEIDMLQQLHHPHIISVLAHGTMVLEALPTIIPQKSNHQNSFPFLILDRLGETLEDKLVAWESKHAKHSSLVGKLVTHRKHRKSNVCARERWQVLNDMASALDYMHEQRIVYRDVKPENVAFDRYNDTLKLIDLGLAKDLKPLTPNRKGLYRLTALTGSARYMAPEVAREESYNESCDVYGLAIVIWQVMALAIPYAKFNVQKMFQVVYDCPHVRPSLERWQEDDEEGYSNRWLVRLLNKMWSPLIEERPTMQEVHFILTRQLEKLDLEEAQQQSLSSP